MQAHAPKAQELQAYAVDPVTLYLWLQGGIGRKMVEAEAAIPAANAYIHNPPPEDDDAVAEAEAAIPAANAYIHNPPPEDDDAVVERLWLQDICERIEEEEALAAVDEYLALCQSAVGD